LGLLDYKTHNGVLRLVKSHCANFVQGGCILTDSQCGYFKPNGGNISCDYFEQAVLPNEPLLEQAYRTQHGITHNEDKPVKQNVGNCKTCGDLFVKGSNRALYCTHCKAVKERGQNRNYMRKARSN
jgi:hypothetical protein